MENLLLPLPPPYADGSEPSIVLELQLRIGSQQQTVRGVAHLDCGHTRPKWVQTSGFSLYSPSDGECLGSAELLVGASVVGEEGLTTMAAMATATRRRSRSITIRTLS